MVSRSSNAAGRGGPTPSARTSVSVTGSRRQRFDHNDLPRISDGDRTTIDGLLREYKFDHVDAPTDGTYIKEFWPAKVLEIILSQDRIIRELGQKRGLISGLLPGVKVRPHLNLESDCSVLSADQ